jgi:flagellar assembly protein FliH
MLCKVLGSKTAVVQPVAWRRGAGAGGKAPKPQSPESSQLQLKVAELEASLEGNARQSYEGGFRAGEESVRRAAQAEVQATLQQLAETIASVAGTRTETIRRAEADTVRLAIEIARRVLHRELSVDGSALEALIKAALEKLQTQEIYRVRIHPEQEKTLKSCLEQAGRGQTVAVVCDPLQPKGGAVFEIARGALDASVDTQLAEIEHGLIDQLEVRS